MPVIFKQKKYSFAGWAGYVCSQVIQSDNYQDYIIRIGRSYGLYGLSTPTIDVKKKGKFYFIGCGWVRVGFFYKDELKIYYKKFKPLGDKLWGEYQNYLQKQYEI